MKDFDEREIWEMQESGRALKLLVGMWVAVIGLATALIFAVMP
jgi:hypothetical protein